MQHGSSVLSRLSASQTKTLNVLADTAKTSYMRMPSVLLLGPSGSGKRSITKAAAHALKLDFVEVPLKGLTSAVIERLVGTRSAAEYALASGSPPGELGSSGPGLVYLSGLQDSDGDLCQILHGLLTNRSYVDQRGVRWNIADTLWIVGSHTVNIQGSKLTPQHWICAAFDRRLTVLPPSSHDELIQICTNIAEELAGTTPVPESILELASGLSQSNDNLHSLRRWMEQSIAIAGKLDLVTRETVKEVVCEDLRWLLCKLQYRGCEVTMEAFRSWWEQFPHEVKPLATHIVRQIAERYYVGARQFHDSLKLLIDRSEIPLGDQVTFCKWQQMGKSGPRLANALKNQAGWRISKLDIDLDKPESTWPVLSSQESKWFILADDFVGSGNSLACLWRSPKAPFRRLLHRYTRSRALVLVVEGFSRGLSEAHSALGQLRARVRVIPANVLTDEDRCLHSASRIFPSSTHRELLRKFCLHLGATEFRGLPARFQLGFDETAALVVFYDTVPNNSLPLLWCAQGNWHPLFPASGLPNAI